MRSRPDASVVIPLYDRERFIADAIESVLAQEYEGTVEIIVVDDGSADSGALVAASFEGVRVLRQENGGPSAARNAGIRAAGGRWLAFLDSDDLMTPSKLSAQIGYLEAHPRVGCVLGRQEVLHGGDLRWLPRDPRFGDPGGVNPVTAVLAVDTARAVGGYDDSLREWEGRDLLMRLRARGVRIDVLDEVVLQRRVHDGNVSHDMSDGREALMSTLRSTLRRRRAGESEAAGHGKIAGAGHEATS